MGKNWPRKPGFRWQNIAGNPDVEHEFEWSILGNAPIKEDLRKSLEALFISVFKPSLNEQTNFERLIIFVNSIVLCRVL